MLTLGIDTALRACSVAIVRGGEVLAHEFAALDRGHAERMPPMAAACLRAAGVNVAALDRIGVVIGPGAFAGVRVGVAFARGIGLGAKLPVIGVDTLQALALAVEPSADVFTAAVVDARREQVYAALYQGRSVIAQPFVAAPHEARARLFETAQESSVIIVGDGVGLLGDLPRNWKFAGSEHVDARVVARYAATASAAISPPAPLYLRAPDAVPAAVSPFAALFEIGDEK